MSDAGDPDVTRLLRDLTRELQTLQREINDESRGILPSGSQLSRFTSEVAIPGIILLLETNIRTLQLLRRTIRLADDRDPRDTSSGATGELRDRAEQLGQTTLEQLDNVLSDVQESLEERDGSDDTRELLSEARQLQSQIREQLETGDERDGSTGISVEEDDSDAVDIDVDAELRTLKDNLEDDNSNGQSGDDGTDGDNGSAGSGEDHDGAGEDSR